MRLRYAILFCSLLAYSSLHAILPLPYPVQPWSKQCIYLVPPPKDPRTIEAYNHLYSGSQLRELELPNFENSSGTLGYDPEETFQTPPELRRRVDFWKQIYTEYTSEQALLHDPDYLDTQYGVLDLRPIISNPKLTERQKNRLISRFFKAEKGKIKEKLKQIHTLKDNPAKIPLDVFTIFAQFKNVRGKDKFLEASKRIRAQVGQHDRVVRGFFLAGRYLKKILQILGEHKIPQELSRLPLVESAFDLSARSRVGASGVWQFMPSTATRFIHVNRALDERNDPITATRAAAQLLRENFIALGSWELAITAYNHGKHGIAKAVRQLATTSLPTIIDNYESETFGFASANFYSEFLAMLEIEREYRDHFGTLNVDPELHYREIPIVDNITLSQLAIACNLTEMTLIRLNPALTEWVRSGQGYVPKSYRLKVPPNRLDRCRHGYNNKRVQNDS